MKRVVFMMRQNHQWQQQLKKFKPVLTISFLLLLLSTTHYCFGADDIDYTCDYNKDYSLSNKCNNIKDGYCDDPNHGGSDPDCIRQDCVDCTIHCKKFEADCYGCVNAQGCYYCPEDGTCTNWRYSMTNKLAKCTPETGGYLSSLLGDDADACIPGDADTQDPSYMGSHWMYEMINVVEVWENYGLTGKGVKIRINDDGVFVDNREFEGRFDDVENSCPNYLADGNHGTAVAGIILGNANNDLCAAGIAHGATFSSCDFFKGDPTGTLLVYKLETFDISHNSIGVPACDEYGAMGRRNTIADEECPFSYNDPTHQPCENCAGEFNGESKSSDCSRAILYHCKLYYKEYTSACIDFPEVIIGDCDYDKIPQSSVNALEQSVTEGRDGKGVIFTFSSGNSFSQGDDVNFGGWTNSRFTITVGAVGKDGFHADYSSGGAALMVTAPAGDNFDVGHLMTAGLGVDACADSGQGTSFSCPVVSGVIALMLEANPELSWRDVQGILAQSSQHVANDEKDDTQIVNGAGFWHSNWYGFGIIDAKAAVEAAMDWVSFPEELQAVGISKDENAVLSDDNGNEFVSTIQLSASEDAYPDDFVAESTVVLLDLSHYNRGDLEIELESPSGTKSRLLPGKRPEANQLNSNERWKLMTVRNWGENPTGTWKLTIRDLVDREFSGDNNVFNGWQLIVYGRLDTAVNVLNNVPTSDPIKGPESTIAPTEKQSSEPTKMPTLSPTIKQTSEPTEVPTSSPISNPTPTKEPESTIAPTEKQSSEPTKMPTLSPTIKQTSEPTKMPTLSPTIKQTSEPTEAPTSSPISNPTSDPTESPTSSPSMRPTLEPTRNPTSEPSPEPTKSPTLQPTRMPSKNPTSQPIAQPTHNIFLEPTASPTMLPAKNISSQPPLTSISFIDIDNADENLSCETSILMQSDLASIRGIISPSPLVGLNGTCLTGLESVGGWYEVIGSGKVFTLTACSLDVSKSVGISVFTGGCSQLDCIKHQSQHVANCDIGNGQAISFTSKPEVIYNILVSGLPVGAELLGSFDSGQYLSLGGSFEHRRLQTKTKFDYSLKLTEAETPLNNKCGSSLPVTFGTSVEGNTAGLLTTYKTCQNNKKSGAWYTVEGGTPTEDGTIVYEANTCSPKSDFYNTMSVFRGDGCGSHECVNVDILPCTNGWFGQQVYWSSNIQETYQIFVHSSDAIAASTYDAGSFQMDLVYDNRLANDQCTAAIELDLKKLEIGKTSGSKPDIKNIKNSSCGSGEAGAWHHIVGTGAVFRASTCNDETNHKTRIHIFYGDCEKLICINSDDTFCNKGNGSKVNFKTVVDVDYYILVASIEGETGKFGLKIKEIEPPDNNDCSAATSLIGDLPALGYTLQATNDFHADRNCGLPLNTPGIWYEIEGKGRGMEISTCSGTFDHAISIFEGSSCRNLECVTGASAVNSECADGQGVIASFIGNKNTKYLVYVHGQPASLINTGQFSISYNEFDVLDVNEFCPSARSIPTDGSRIQVSIEDATHASIPSSSCGVPMTNPGLWYTFRGSGRPFQISACAEDEGDVDVDVSVSVFVGGVGGCESLTCLTGTTFDGDVCYSTKERLLNPGGISSSAFRLMTKNNQNYYIFVHRTDVGDFDFFVQEEDLADKDISDENIADKILADVEPDESLADESLADESLADESLADESLADENIADENIIDENLADERTSQIELSIRYGKDLDRWIPANTELVVINTNYLELEIVNPPSGSVSTEGNNIHYVPPLQILDTDTMTVDGCNDGECFRFNITITFVAEDLYAKNSGQNKLNQNDATKKDRSNLGLLWLLLLLLLPFVCYPIYRYYQNKQGSEDNDDSDVEEIARFDDDDDLFVQDEKGSLFNLLTSDDGNSDPGDYESFENSNPEDCESFENSNPEDYESFENSNTEDCESGENSNPEDYESSSSGDDDDRSYDYSSDESSDSSRENEGFML